MKIWSHDFNHNERIPDAFAFGKYDEKEHCVLSTNLNPHLAWSELPQGTQSLALLCDDPDVPSKPDDVNQVEKIVSAELPRINFFHWVLVDLDPAQSELRAGEFSRGITIKGKAGPAAPGNTRQGLNNYTNWFEGDPKMGGNYFGYDGPCPPWNDELIHHYRFTLFATDLQRCPVEGTFSGPDVLRAIDGHILEKACLVGLYSINPTAALCHNSLI